MQNPPSGVAICLLLAYDRPFAAGGVTPTPTAFREIKLRLEP